ncbi:hypothetical protein [uncultured Paludibaculum sp.]|uniref:hypothetical protein n=1 Tax=uncultured Paludibaculum sp. TaxID=1765020 RepID=UPI002AABF933|nr:hypothetical protein [uncultured Paludibaculum sp.]
MTFTDNGIARSISVPLTDQQALELANALAIEVGATIGQARLQQTVEADTAFLASLGVSPQ